MAALGYAYLFLVVFGLLGLVAVSVWAMIRMNELNILAIKVLWIPLVLAGLVLRSMWINIPLPEGKEVEREQAPELFSLVRDVRSLLGGPEIHHVLLSDELNASIVQIPRFGMFGGTGNYLVIGLPLLKAIGPEEFRAVIAHEFGHLSGKHGKFIAWIYRIRESWIQILRRVKTERHYASFLFDWFIKWYAPYFNAYSFVLARAQEYEADQSAVETAGQTVAARALVAIKLKARALQGDLWSNFYRHAGDQPQAPKNTFALMLTEVERPLTPLKIKQWLRQELTVMTGYDDTHPALAERLRGMGFEDAELSSNSLVQTLNLKDEPPQESAAQHLLKEAPADIIERYDRLWREQIVPAWKQKHEAVQQARKRLAELEQESETRPLAIDEQWERARCLAATKDAAAALPIVREIIRQDPDHVRASFALGATLLEQQDATGIAYLQKAMHLDSATTGDACLLLSEFYQAQDRQSEAETYWEKAKSFYERQQRLQQEAVNLTVYDQFEPHDLNDEDLQRLKIQLSKTYGLAAAYLVRRIVEQEPTYVLAVLASYTWKNGRSGKHVGDLINELAGSIELRKPTVFVSLDAKPHLAQAISQVSGAEVCLRDREAGAELRH